MLASRLLRPWRRLSENCRLAARSAPSRVRCPGGNDAVPGRYPGRTPGIHQFSHLAHPGSGARETVPRDIVRARGWVPHMDARGWSAANDPERREVTRATPRHPGDALSPPPGWFFPSGIPRAPAVIPWCTSDVRSDHRASRTLNVPRLKPGDARVESGRRDFSNARGTRRPLVY